MFADAIATRIGTSPESDPLPRAAAAAALSTLLTTLEFWAGSDEPEPMEDLLRSAFDRLGAGFDHLA